MVDLDFPNNLTQDVSRFNDAYHFDSKVARQIVGQVIPLITKNTDAIKKVIKRQHDVKCSVENKKKSIQVTQSIRLSKGENCRVWSMQK